MMNENVVQQNHFALSEGEFFEFKDSYRTLPVVIGGTKYANIKINTIIQITLYPDEELDLQNPITLDAIVVGKIGEYLTLPETKVNDNETGLLQSETIIIAPDIYAEVLLNNPSKEIILSFKSPPDSDLIYEIVKHYGNMTSNTFVSNYNLVSPFQDPVILLSVIIITICLAIILYQLYFTYYVNFNTNIKKNSFIWAVHISLTFIIPLILLLIFNKTQLFVVYLPIAAFMYLFLIKTAISAIMLVVCYNKKKKNLIIEKVDYEKIYD